MTLLRRPRPKPPRPARALFGRLAAAGGNTGDAQVTPVTDEGQRAFGARIAALRAERGVTQKQFAAEIGPAPELAVPGGARRPAGRPPGRTPAVAGRSAPPELRALADRTDAMG